jgi:integrase
VYQKRRTEIAERRFFPERRAPWDPSLGDWLDDYLARKASTLRGREGVERYARYFREAPETRGKTMRDLATRDFERYRERRRGKGADGAKRKRRGAGESTINKELSFARAVFNDFIEALEDRGEAPIPNPVRRRLFYPEPAGRVRYLSDAEERRLRDALPDADGWAKVRVAMLTGIDRGAQFGLRWDVNVDFQARVIRTERHKGRRTGATPVAVAINDELLELLRALPSRLSSAWVFPNAAATGPADGPEFDRRVFRPALKRAGIKGFRWKDLRHTFASRLRMNGVDLATIRDLLGHTTTRMTERYAHVAPSHLHAAVQTLSRPTASEASIPQGSTGARTANATRGGGDVSMRPDSGTRSVPGGIRTHVIGVKGHPRTMTKHELFAGNPRLIQVSASEGFARL